MLSGRGTQPHKVLPQCYRPGIITPSDPSPLPAYAEEAGEAMDQRLLLSITAVWQEPPEKHVTSLRQSNDAQ